MSLTTIKISQVTAKVESLLMQSSQYRNNDDALVVRFWWDELPNKEISAKDFLIQYKLGNLTSADTITRARRKLQELYPHLRGEVWEKRHKEARDTQFDIFNVI